MHRPLPNIVLIFICLLPSAAFAQTVAEPISVMVAPDVPGPNETVVIEVQGVGGFLGDATVTWRENGTVVREGVGESRFVFKTGALGSRTTVEMTIDSSKGQFVRQFVFNPSLVNLVWEADTTVPPFFCGKALYSAGSPLKVLALPTVYSDGSHVAASALSYRWSRNDEPVQNASGLGRSSISFVGDQLQPQETVGVDVYWGAAKVAQAGITIPAVNPTLVLYQHDPLRGTIYDTAFPLSVTLLGKEITVRAEPFYFSAADVSAGNVQYSWLLNGAEVTGPDSAGGALTLRQTGEGTGGASVEVSAQNYGAGTFVQQAAASLRLFFGQSSILNSLFGI